MTRAIVFANGEFSEYACAKACISEEDFLVVVDGGAKHCLSMKLQPHLLIGDLDSVGSRERKALRAEDVECITFPPEKDASDLELTLQVLSDRSYTEVVLLGVTGGRTDHSLFNWQLAAGRNWPFKIRLIDDSVDAYCVNNNQPLEVADRQNSVFSVLSVSNHANGVNITGAKYALQDADIYPGNTLGLSNEVVEPVLKVSVNEGMVIVMLVHHD